MKSLNAFTVASVLLEGATLGAYAVEEVTAPTGLGAGAGLVAATSLLLLL